jgi:hypothetical protein
LAEANKNVNASRTNKGTHEEGCSSPDGKEGKQRSSKGQQKAQIPS